MAFMLLLFFLMTTTIEQEAGIPTELPPIEAVSYSSGRYVRIILNNQNDFLIDNKPVQSTTLQQEIQSILLENPKTNFSLRTNLDARYDTYVGVYDAVRSGYRNLYDHVAREQYGQSFRQLDQSVQNEIKARFPMKISEEFPAQ